MKTVMDETGMVLFAPLLPEGLYLFFCIEVPHIFGIICFAEIAFRQTNRLNEFLIGWIISLLRGTICFYQMKIR